MKAENPQSVLNRWNQHIQAIYTHTYTHNSYFDFIDSRKKLIFVPLAHYITAVDKHS